MQGGEKKVKSTAHRKEHVRMGITQMMDDLRGKRTGFLEKLIFT